MERRLARKLRPAQGGTTAPATRERRRSAPWLMLEQFAYQGHDPAQEEPIFRATVRNDGPVDAPRARLEIWRRFDRDSRYSSRAQVVPSEGRAHFEVLVPQEWMQDGGVSLRRGVRARIVDVATGAACEVWPR